MITIKGIAWNQLIFDASKRAMSNNDNKIWHARLCKRVTAVCDANAIHTKYIICLLRERCTRNHTNNNTFYRKTFVTRRTYSIKRAITKTTTSASLVIVIITEYYKSRNKRKIKEVKREIEGSNLLGDHLHYISPCQHHKRTGNQAFPRGFHRYDGNRSQRKF